MGGVPGEEFEAYARMLDEVSATGRRLRRDELDALRASGRRASGGGSGLRGLVGAYVAATRDAWGTLRGVAAADTATEVQRAGEAVLTALDAAVLAIGEGHQRGQRLLVRQDEAARGEFVDDLLYGRSDPGRLAERAERFGLRLGRGHAVAVARGEDAYEDSQPVVRRVERELVGRFGHRDVLVAGKDGRLVCIAPGGERAVFEAFADTALRPGPGYGAARRVAVGRTHSGTSGIVRSYEEALGALDVADRLRLHPPVLRAEELLVFPVLMRDRAAMADLVHSVLGPLEQARGGAGPLLETITAHAEAGHVNAEAARRLGVGVRTFTYRLERIKVLTGYDPGDPLHRYTLETAAMGARLLGWPDLPL
ncbi:PucR family transcriptional regulator [Actinacidiphila glaucinigra]|uniref:PucR family transcriptional regulator n=1 Tax=Actinacidiphila glaucinigra TaxID=235986 RepID=UPI002E380579|nr:helix-turn-helix domain-containing protein [Actinacidiphila glaucinigra]